MELNEMEKKLLFQVEGDYQTKILNELYMTVRYSNNSEQREAAEGLMAKLRVLSNAECMDLVKDIQKNYRLPYPARTIGEKIAEARQQSGAEKLKGHSLSPGPDVARPLRSPICRNGGSAQKSFASVYKPGFFTKPGIMENRFVYL